MTINQGKVAAGDHAAELINDGMRVGLGTGSTANCFIQALGNRCRLGLSIEAVASSKASEGLAKAAGIPLISIDDLTELDIVVDGADEIDTKKRMIKGGGGALLREKIVATMAREMVVIIDPSKCVEQLGRFPLPIEIVPFGYRATINHLSKNGYLGKLRKNEDSSLFLTDNQNLIFDIHFDELREDPESDHIAISSITGVVETGFFFNLAGRVIIGHPNGDVELK